MSRLTLVPLLGSSGHGALDSLGGLVDGVPGRRLDQQIVETLSKQEASGDEG